MFNTLLQHYCLHRVCGQQAYGEVSFYIQKCRFNTQFIFIFSFLTRRVDLYDIINTISYSTPFYICIFILKSGLCTINVSVGCLKNNKTLWIHLNFPLISNPCITNVCIVCWRPEFTLICWTYKHTLTIFMY